MESDAFMEDHRSNLGFAILCVVSTLIASTWCWFQWKYRKLLRVAAKLPTIYPAYPLIGHIYLLVYGLKTQHIVEAMRKAAEAGTKTFCLWFGPFPVIVFGNSADIQVILNSSIALEKGVQDKYLTRGLQSEVGPMTHNIINASADLWKPTRRHLNSLFFPRNLQLLIPSFNKTCRELVASLTKYVDQGHIDIIEPLKVVGFKSICGLLFGPDTVMNDEIDFEHHTHVIKMYEELIAKRMTEPWFWIEAVYRFLYGKKHQKVELAWRRFTETCIKTTNDSTERKREERKKRNNDGDNDNYNDRDSMTVLDAFNALREKHPYFTDADLRAEILILYLAGIDTTSVTMSFCLMALAQHEDIQDRLYNEILTVVGPERNVELEDLNNMKYLEQVLKETLRRFTAIPFLIRKTSQDLKLDSCTIPSGSTVGAGLYGVHMDPKIFPKPEIFYPERFSSEKVTPVDKFAFMPFSGGPRNCIGKVYAMWMMKVVMVHLVRKYRIRAVHDIYRMRLKYGPTLSFVDGFPVVLEHRR